MNLKKFFAPFALLPLLLASCEENAQVKEPDPVYVRFNCTLSLDGENLAFENNEVISLYDGKVAENYKGTPLGRLAPVAGSNAVLWTASVVETNMYYAVYPQSRLKNWAADGSRVVTLEAPAGQVAYAPGLSKEASVFYARTPGSVKNLNFEPALALVGFTIDESSPLVCAVEVASASGASLAGTFSVDLSAFDPTAPTVKTGASAKVRLTSFDGECPLDPGTYYIGILPGVYAPGDLSITYTYNNGNTRTEPLTDFPAKIQGGVSYACGTLRPVQESGGATISDPDFKEKVDIYDIFLLIGQSNMAGRGVLTAADKAETVEGVWLLGPDNAQGQAEPVAATHPFNQYSTVRKDISMQQMNPGYGFVTTIRGHTGGRPILVVCNALGGTSLDQWSKTAADSELGPNKTYSNLYKEAVRRCKLALQYGTLKGILWHQGCSDGSSSKVSTYLSRLNTLATNLRTDLEAPDVPFIAGELAYWRSSSPAFNEMIHGISSKVPNSDWVSAEGCTIREGYEGSTDPHFSRAGQVLLGSRYGQKILNMVYNKN